VEGERLTVDQAYMALRNVPLFKEMNEEHLRYIAEHARFVTLEKDAFVFHRGDHCKGFYITIQGNIKISFLSMEGKEHVARIVGPGQTFAEAMAFLKKPSPATVQAMTPAKVLFLPSEVIFKCINENPACACSMLAGLSRRLHLLVTELESVTLNSSQQRVIGFLLQHLQTNADETNETKITLQANKSTIASHLNLTPETLSRILQHLSKEKLISVHGKIIHIHNIKELRSF
jgi:CRP-like cAMP-binding protein